MNTIKKLTSTIITAMVMLTVMAPICMATTGTITVDSLRVRKTPSTSAAIVRNLEIGLEVEILSEEGEWYKIKLQDGTEAYVYAEYVELVKNGTTDENNQETTDNQEIEKDITKIELTKNSNIYILPALFSNQISRINENVTLDVLEKMNNWVKVEYNGITGWVINKPTVTTQETNIDEQPQEEPETQETVSTELTENQIGYINVTSAFVRERPAKDGVITQSLYLNNKVTILSEEGEWYKIETSEGTGYVYAELISSSETTTSRGNISSRKSVSRDRNISTSETLTTPETVQEPVVEETVIKTGYVNATALNVREEASKDSEVINVLKQKAKVEILSEDGDWYKVKLNSENGYVLKTYIVDSLDKVVVKAVTKTTTSSSSSKGTQVVVNGSASDLVSYARTFIGCKYVYGGSGPSSFDCSGFVMYIYKHFGVNLPHSAVSQAKYGTSVSRSNLQPGDILIFRNQSNTSIGHSAIYVGDGKFVHAANSSRGVTTDSFSSSYYSTRFIEGRRLI